MKQAKHKLWVVAGILLLLVALLLGLLSQQSTRPGGDSINPSASSRKNTSKTERDHAPERRVPPLRHTPVGQDRETVRHLQDLMAKGDLHAIDDLLGELAESHRLHEISDLLHEWCRGENLELAQWALIYTEDDDPALHLKLCADALSHSSEAIRENARAKLESISGRRFMDSTEAVHWLVRQTPQTK